MGIHNKSTSQILFNLAVLTGRVVAVSMWVVSGVAGGGVLNVVVSDGAALEVSAVSLQLVVIKVKSTVPRRI
jgi:hypothetical protein